MRTPLLLLNERYGDRGETERYLLHFAELFTDLGYRIALAYGRKWPPAFSSPIIREQLQPFLAERERPATPFELRRLREVAQRTQARLAFLHDIFDGQIVGAMKEAGLPVVWFVHDHFPHCLAAPPRDGVPRRAEQFPLRQGAQQPLAAASGEPRPAAPPGPQALLRQRHSLLAAAAQCDRVVVASEYMADLLQRTLPGTQLPLAVLPPHVRPVFLPRRPAPDGAVLYAGAIRPERGVAELIQAMRRVRSAQPRRLWVAGEAPEAAYLARCRAAADEAMAADPALTVAFHCDPSEHALERLYEEAALLAVPTLWPEPFPLEVLEGMERGLPVVAFDAGGTGALVRHGHTGLLARPGDVDDLGRMLAQLLAEPARAQQMGVAAQHLVDRRYDPREHVAALDRIFEALLYPPRLPVRAPVPEGVLMGRPGRPRPRR